jgi:hypothetical protein
MRVFSRLGPGLFSRSPTRPRARPRRGTFKALSGPLKLPPPPLTGKIKVSPSRRQARRRRLQVAAPPVLMTGIHLLLPLPLCRGGLL